jgi:hypothetical protein
MDLPKENLDAGNIQRLQYFARCCRPRKDIEFFTKNLTFVEKSDKIPLGIKLELLMKCLKDPNIVSHRQSSVKGEEKSLDGE